MFQQDSACYPFIDCMRIFHLDACKTHVQKCSDWHVPPTLSQGKDHTLDLLLFDDPFEIANPADDSRVDQWLTDIFAMLVQKADYSQIEFWLRDRFASQLDSSLCRPNHKHPFCTRQKGAGPHYS